MSTNAQPISVTYSDEKLRILIEEYITMQRKEFTFKGVCSYILHRAMEEERTEGTTGFMRATSLILPIESELKSLWVELSKKTEYH